MDRAAFRWAGACAVLLAIYVGLAPGAASAQTAYDPATVVARYAAALNAHALSDALALFDQQYGSATDGQSRSFSGTEGLTAFLLDNGFATSDARITTRRLTVVANRAIWIYACTCAASDTTVHLVLNIDGKLSVFAMMAPSAAPTQTRTGNELLPWLIGLALLLTGGVGWLFGARHSRRTLEPTRPMQGQLLLALREAQSEYRRRPNCDDTCIKRYSTNWTSHP